MINDHEEGVHILYIIINQILSKTTNHFEILSFIAINRSVLSQQVQCVFGMKCTIERYIVRETHCLINGKKLFCKQKKDSMESTTRSKRGERLDYF